MKGAIYQGGDETRQSFSYDYDEIGNRKSYATEVGDQRSEVRYENNALNQYKSITVDQRRSAVQYDPDGNLTEDDQNRYTWDSENRLVRVDAKDGSLRLDYAYDHRSRRSLRTETVSPGTENQELIATFYVYDGWNVLAEVESSAAPSRPPPQLRFLTWGRDLSGRAQGAGGVGGLLAINHRCPSGNPEQGTKDEAQKIGGTHFVAYDANGNVAQLIDESATIIAAYTYDPFGNVMATAGLYAEGNPWQFSTKPVDAGTGWLYYGYRYLNTRLGRWTSRDPIGELGGINLLCFASNNGVNAFDLLGQIAWFCNSFEKDGCRLKCKDLNEDYVGCIKHCKIYGTDKSLVSCACKKRCKPCIPEINSIAYRVDMPPSPAHNGIPTPHSHEYKMQQSPPSKDCRCFWKEILKDPLPGIHGPPIAPAGGGGPL